MKNILAFIQFLAFVISGTLDIPRYLIRSKVFANLSCQDEEVI